MIKQSQYKTASKIVRLGNAITWLRNIKMQEYELTATQSEAIRYILKQPTDREITAKDLIGDLNLSQSTVAGIVKRLEAKGLITRKTDETDARKNAIIITEKGMELEEVLRTNAVATEELLLKGLSDKEKTEFYRLLEKAFDNVNSVRFTQEGTNNDAE